MLTEVLEDPGTKAHLKDEPISFTEISSALVRSLLTHPPFSLPHHDPIAEAVEMDLASSALTTTLKLLGSALSFSSQAAVLRLSMLECKGPSDEDIISFTSQLLQHLRSNPVELVPGMPILSLMGQENRNELVKAILSLLMNLLYRCTPAQVSTYQQSSHRQGIILF